MGKIEELLIRKKSYEEIALFLGVSISLVSEYMSRPTPRRIIRESSTFRELIQTEDNSDCFTIKDLDYVKENEPSYFRELLRNDYVLDDKIHTDNKKNVLEASEIDLAIKKTKDILTVSKFMKQ